MGCKSGCWTAYMGSHSHFTASQCAGLPKLSAWNSINSFQSYSKVEYCLPSAWSISSIIIMESVVPSLMFATVIIILFSSSAHGQQQGNTCNACNCQFNNVEVLTQLIKSVTAESVGKPSLLLLLLLVATVSADYLIKLMYTIIIIWNIILYKSSTA